MNPDDLAREAAAGDLAHAEHVPVPDPHARERLPVAAIRRHLRGKLQTPYRQIAGTLQANCTFLESEDNRGGLADTQNTPVPQTQESVSPLLPTQQFQTPFLVLS